MSRVDEAGQVGKLAAMLGVGAALALSGAATAAATTEESASSAGPARAAQTAGVDRASSKPAAARVGGRRPAPSSGASILPRPAAASAPSASMNVAATPGGDPIGGFFQSLATFFNNQTPTLAPTRGSQGVNGVVAGNLNAVDPDSPKLTYTIAAGPTRGNVVVSADGQYVYTPNSAVGATGTTDSFTVTVSDAASGFAIHGIAGLINLLTFGLVGSRGDSSSSTVTIALTPFNNTPTATVVVGPPNPVTGIVTGTITGIDPDGDRITYSADNTTAQTVTLPAGPGVYNWKPSNTARARFSLAQALAGEGASEQLIIGDSESSFYTGSATYRQMWPEVMRQFIADTGVPIGGTGWVMTGNDPRLPLDPRWSKSGTWQDSGIGYLYTRASGSALTFTSDLAGTDVEVAYFNNSAPFTVSIDGGPAHTVTPNQSEQGGSIYKVSGLADTSHTVTIAAISDGPKVIPLGVNVSRSTGLIVDNVSRGGAMAALWTNPAYGSRGWATNQLALTPDVVHVALGVNDLNWGRTTDQTINDLSGLLTEIRTQWPDADIILYGQYAPSADAMVQTPRSDADWADYISQLHGVADAFDVPLVDLYGPSGGYDAANSAGLMGDTVHPSVAAQADWGQLVGQLLTADETEIHTAKGDAVLKGDGSYIYTPNASAREKAARPDATQADRTDTFTITLTDGTDVVTVPVTVPITV